MPSSNTAFPTPGLYFVDEGTEWSGTVLRRLYDRPTKIWATTFDGQLLWLRTFTGPTIKDVAADAHGGLILVLDDTFGTSNPRPQRVQRIDGATGKVSWEYVADDGDLSEVAVHPDGTIFVTDEEYHSANTYLVAIDGLSGTTNRWRLPWRYYQPFASGPIVRDDRTVQVLFNPHDDDWTHLQLATVLATDAPPVTTDLYLARRPSAPFDPWMYRLIPQASGGLFVGQRWGGTNVLRMDPGGELSEIVPLIASPLISAGVGEIDYAVTDTVGRALVKRYTDETTRPYEVYDISFDPTTLSPDDAPWPSTDPYVSFRLISTDGAVYASGEAGGMFGANDNQVASGIWVTLGAGPSMTLGSEVDVHWASSYLQGSSSSTNGADRRIYVPQPLQTEPNQGIIRATILKLRDALVAEGNSTPPGSCAAWLNTGPLSGVAMIDLLLDPFHTDSGDKDKWGHGVFSRLPDKIVFTSAQNHIYAFAYGENPGGIPIGIPVYFAVTFNDNGAFFSAFDRSSTKELFDGPYRGGTSQARVRILVHELAHLVSAKGFKHDLLDDVAKVDNERMVQTNCGPLVGGIQ